MSEETDKKFMKRALVLARKGVGKCAPNPMVGAVLTDSGGRVVASGYHRGPGTRHAEVAALMKAGKMARGGTLYVTLEPCNHHGRTPPCVDAILAAEIDRVVVAMSDPNPGVKGGGNERLKASGVRVELGLMEEEALELNRAYLKRIITGVPWFCLKTAVTLDGKIASCRGDSRWITSERSRNEAHKLRREAGCILSGRGTVSLDDPSFTVRLSQREEEYRLVVVADSLARTPLSAKVFQVADRKAGTLLAVTSNAPEERVRAIQEQGVEVLYCGQGPSVDPWILASALGDRGVNHVLVEAGGTLNASLIEGDWIDEFHLFIGPFFLGGKEAPSPMDGEGWDRVAEAPRMDLRKMRRIGTDVWLQYRRLEAEEPCSQGL